MVSQKTINIICEVVWGFYEYSSLCCNEWPTSSAYKLVDLWFRKCRMVGNEDNDFSIFRHFQICASAEFMGKYNYSFTSLTKRILCFLKIFVRDNKSESKTQLLTQST